MSIEDQIQAAAEQGAAIIGTEETLKRMDTLETVVVAENAPADLVEPVEAAAEEADVAVEHLSVDGKQLGSLCGEPFMASIVGIKG